MIFGSAPAPHPIQAAAIIWKANHGPAPPVNKADANKTVNPSKNPNRFPKARPPKIIKNQIGSIPIAPAPNIRNAAPVAVSTPKNAKLFTSRSPCVNSIIKIKSAIGISAKNKYFACPLFSTCSAEMKSGHAKAKNPMMEAKPRSGVDLFMVLTQINSAQERK